MAADVRSPRTFMSFTRSRIRDASDAS